MNEAIPEIQLNVARKVLAHAQAKDGSFSFDPWTIMAICNCIISVCKLLYMCYGKSGAAGRIKNPSLLQKIILKKEIRKHFSKEERQTMYVSMLDACNALSVTELSKLMDSTQE